ncbi:MAG: hypothetical protein NVSMB5_00250 [Candidatus Velthaea sp.]
MEGPFASKAARRGSGRNTFGAVAFALAVFGALLGRAIIADAGPASPSESLNGLRFATERGVIDVRRYRGKVIYLNFFASWCPPCNKEAPTLAALARKYAARGLVVIGIDEGEDARHALGFRKRYDLPYAIALDPASTAEAPFGPPSLPMHVFFDRNGALAVTERGVLDATAAASTIEMLLDAPVPKPTRAPI